MLFSDSPEYVEENGILYSDVVDGNGRIFYYHLNNTNQNKKIAVVMENQGKYTAVDSILTAKSTTSCFCPDCSSPLP